MKIFLPLILFVVVFLGSGLYFQSQGIEFAFYQLPAPVSIIPAIFLALWFAKGSLDQRLETFFKGMGDSNVLTMCLIYLLAGAFSVITKSIGAVDAAVNLGLAYAPANLIIPGMFIMACLLSFAMGTSMGTISALGPIALGIVNEAGISASLLFGALVGGAMFGDNLSVISDTTIAATRTQGAKMADKFKANFFIAFPAAVLTIIYLATVDVQIKQLAVGEFQFVKIIPYLLLSTLALLGLNVFAVLTLGIISAGLVGVMSLESYSSIQFAKDMFKGFTEMQEIFLLSLFLGGLGAMMKEQGGVRLIQNAFQFLSKKLSFEGKVQRLFTELTLCFSVSVANLAVANNTVAILICGDFFKEISHREGISAKRAASLLDTFSCIIQGIIPYGAQVLLASQLAKISPLDLIQNITYCYVLFFCAVVSMLMEAWRVKKEGP